MSLMSAVFDLDHGHEVPCRLVAEFEYVGAPAARDLVEWTVDQFTDGVSMVQWTGEHEGRLLTVCGGVVTGVVSLSLPGEIPVIDVFDPASWVFPTFAG